MTVLAQFLIVQILCQPLGVVASPLRLDTLDHIPDPASLGVLAPGFASGDALGIRKEPAYALLCLVCSLLGCGSTDLTSTI